MTDTLMTDGATQQAAPTSQDATGATQTEVTTTTEAGATHATNQQPPADKPAEGAETKADDKPADSKVPESYDLKAPEGVEIAEADMTVFSDTAKTLGLTQEQAQKFVELAAARRADAEKASADMLTQARQGWADAAKTDKEIGGDKLPENLALAKKALTTFGTPELTTLLNDSGLGNHPAVIRAFVKVGQAISEDRFVPGQGGKTADDPATSFYPTMKK